MAGIVCVVISHISASVCECVLTAARAPWAAPCGTRAARPRVCRSGAARAGRAAPQSAPLARGARGTCSACRGYGVTRSATSRSSSTRTV